MTALLFQLWKDPVLQKWLYLLFEKFEVQHAQGPNADRSDVTLTSRAICYVLSLEPLGRFLASKLLCPSILHMQKFSTIGQMAELWENILFFIQTNSFPWKPMALAPKLDHPRPARKVWCQSVEKPRSSFRTNIQTRNSNYSMINLINLLLWDPSPGRSVVVLHGSRC